MISELANLATQSLIIFKKIGDNFLIRLINDNILSIILMDRNKIIEKRKSISSLPFFNEIQKIFLTEEIILTIDGYTLMKNAYLASDSNLSDVFSNEQLPIFSNNKDAKWILLSVHDTKTPTTHFKPNSRYIKSIVQLAIDDYSFFRPNPSITSNDSTKNIYTQSTSSNRGIGYGWSKRKNNSNKDANTGSTRNSINTSKDSNSSMTSSKSPWGSSNSKNQLHHHLFSKTLNGA